MDTYFTRADRSRWGRDLKLVRYVEGALIACRRRVRSSMKLRPTLTKQGKNAVIHHAAHSANHISECTLRAFGASACITPGRALAGRIGVINRRSRRCGGRLLRRQRIPWCPMRFGAGAQKSPARGARWDRRRWCIDASAATAANGGPGAGWGALRGGLPLDVGLDRCSVQPGGGVTCQYGKENSR